MAKDETDSSTKDLISEINKSKNYDYTARERKKREREEMKKLGFRRLDDWVHDDDREEVKKIIEKKKTKRLNLLTP